MNGSSLFGTAQRHDGSIEIESAPGSDTSVQFNVPVREIDLEAGRGDPPQAGSRRSVCILCIDDDPLVREFMKDCLTHFEHRVTVASGGKQGLELFRAARLNNQPYEIVVTDLGMPDIDGHQVARAIKAESPGTPVILMTGSGSMIKEDRETVSAVDAVVGKPPRMQELNDLLIQMASQRG
ncbi:MAG: response regulator [Verrucomicrobiia bacterium]